jgi:hypothetical protein
MKQDRAACFGKGPPARSSRRWIGSIPAACSTSVRVAVVTNGTLIAAAMCSAAAVVTVLCQGLAWILQ